MGTGTSSPKSSVDGELECARDRRVVLHSLSFQSSALSNDEGTHTALRLSGRSSQAREHCLLRKVGSESLSGIDYIDWLSSTDQPGFLGPTGLVEASTICDGWLSVIASSLSLSLSLPPVGRVWEAWGLEAADAPAYECSSHSTFGPTLRREVGRAKVDQV